MNPVGKADRNAPDVDHLSDIREGLSFDELEVQLSSYSLGKLMVLVPEFGPFPFYRQPYPGEKIKGTTQETFVIPRDPEYMLVMVRTQDQDMPLSFERQGYTNQSLMDVLSSAIQRTGKTIRRIKDCYSGNDVGQKNIVMHLAEAVNTYPTVALVDTTDGSFQFRDDIANDAALPLETLFLGAQDIVRAASAVEVDRLQCIHLARAALHLVVCAEEIVGTELSGDDFSYILGLERLLEEVSKSISEGAPLDLAFKLLCGDYHGATEIRRSYKAYQQLQQVDAMDQTGSVTSQEELSRIRPSEGTNTTQPSPTSGYTSSFVSVHGTSKQSPASDPATGLQELPLAQSPHNPQSYSTKSKSRAITSPQARPGQPLPTIQASIGTSDVKLREPYRPENVDKKNQINFDISDTFERLITVTQIMKERMAPQDRDAHLSWIQDWLTPADIEARPDDGPSSPSDSEESSLWSSAEESQPSSNGVSFSHNYSIPNAWQPTDSSLDLQIQALEPLSTTSGPAAPSSEVEDKDRVPDLTGSVKLLSRIPVYSSTYTSVYIGMWQGQQVAVKVIRASESLKAARVVRIPVILSVFVVNLTKDRDFDVRLWYGVDFRIRISYASTDYAWTKTSVNLANILVDDDGSARLCDFGLASLMQDNDIGKNIMMADTSSVRNFAQELVVGDSLIPTTETDCHALGCIVLEFAYLHPPYVHRNSHAAPGLLYLDIARGIPPSLCPEYIQNLHEDHGHVRLWDLLEICWHIEPQQRPSAARIYNYLWQYKDTIIEALKAGIDVF
ncbi:hypothetical protein FRC17_007965 [Serendipita sp. 399]|nr:hypothetical protein FRC17_007965 [Serendipita sp. 399]